MKKVVIAAFALVTLSAVSANAQTKAPASPKTPAATAPTATPASPTQTTPPAQTEPAAPATAPAEDKVAVDLAELPAAVKATLASPSLKAWQATEAFLVKGADGKEYYAINIKKENESGSVQLDKDGKPVK